MTVSSSSRTSHSPRTNSSSAPVPRPTSRHRKPRFVVKASHFADRIKERWRFPGGRHSPIRQQHRGKPPLASIGYGSPRTQRGMHPSGRYPVVVHTIADLERLDKQREVAVLARGIGKRKWTILLRAAQEKNILLLQVKDVAETLKQLGTSFAERRELRKQWIKRKESKRAEKEKIAEKKSTKAKMSAEQKKEQEEGKKQEGKGKQEGFEENIESVAAQQREEEKVLAEKTLTKRQ